MNDSLDPILQQEEQRKLRTQLTWRLAIAAILVAGVLGTLAWLDKEKEQKPQVTVSAPRHIRIAPRASALPASPIVAASLPAAAPAASAPQTLPLEASAPETAKPQTASIQTALPSKTDTPSPALTPVRTMPAPITRAVISPINKPLAPVVVPPSAPSKPVEPTRPVMPNRVAEPGKPIETINVASKAAAESALPTPDKLARQAAAPATRYPVPVATPNGYTVQAGVFLHATNAEKMLRQVQGAGIPAYLETRVQIGPFSNKAEAEVAVRKLQKLGLEPVIKGN